MLRLMAMLVVVAVTGDAAAAQGTRRTMRFQNLDRNNDGVITRAEWNGNDRSFQSNDWNGDGILSGEEVRPGAQRRGTVPAGRAPDQIPDLPRDGGFDDWTAEAFATFDRNRDGRLTRREWRADAEAFDRADHNGDDIVTRAEFLNEDIQLPDRNNRFDDRRAVVRGDEPFSAWDENRDGAITTAEWQGTRDRFERLDANRDGRITQAEFRATNGAPAESAAYRAGHERGLVEGRQAGREDFARRRWDLEGQRELEQGDSGYMPAHGSRTEYQAGYRDGFRRAYREAWAQ